MCWRERNLDEFQTMKKDFLTINESDKSKVITDGMLIQLNQVNNQLNKTTYII